MSFNFIPKSSTEEEKDIAELYRYIVANSYITSWTIATDPSKPTLVKVIRSLETEGLDLKKIPVDIGKLKAGFGNGTRQAWYKQGNLI